MTAIELAPEVTPTAVGLQIPQSITKDQWKDIGSKLIRAGTMFQWAIGDWAAYGRRFDTGETITLKEFAAMNDIDYDYLRNLCTVSLSVKMSHRCDRLSWSHHREVATEPERKQPYWLKRALDENLSARTLRELILASRSKLNAKEPDGETSRRMGGLLDTVKNFVIQQPPDWWDEDRRMIWKARLKPLVELYNHL